MMSFTACSRSDRIVERLNGRFLPAFEAILSSGPGLLPGQEDVTAVWRRSHPSVARAVGFHVVPGVSMAIVLLDDEDFGREIAWYFDEARGEDFKWILMAAEAGTSILAGAGEPCAGSGLFVAVGTLGPGEIRSDLFCYSFASSDLVPPGAGVAVLAPWEVAMGLMARVHEVAAGKTEVQIERPDGPCEHLRAVLLMLKAQLGLMSRG